jgi:hypothetical protein
MRNPLPEPERTAKRVQRPVRVRIAISAPQALWRAGRLTRLLPQEEDSFTNRMVCPGEVSMSAVGLAVRSELPGVTCGVSEVPRVGVG